MHLLETALKIALDAHLGQVDKAGRPYILHPLRLMMGLESETEKIAALLHDVVEDSHVTTEDLRTQGIPAEVIEIIECLTKRSHETYDDFIKRIAGNKKAVRVKIKDIEDNMNLARLDQVMQKDLERLSKYHRALKYLKNLG